MTQPDTVPVPVLAFVSLSPSHIGVFAVCVGCGGDKVADLCVRAFGWQAEFAGEPSERVHRTVHRVCAELKRVGAAGYFNKGAFDAGRKEESTDVQFLTAARDNTAFPWAYRLFADGVTPFATVWNGNMGLSYSTTNDVAVSQDDVFGFAHLLFKLDQAAPDTTWKIRYDPTPGTVTDPKADEKVERLRDVIRRQVNSLSLESVFGNRPDWKLADIAIDAMRAPMKGRTARIVELEAQLKDARDACKRMKEARTGDAVALAGKRINELEAELKKLEAELKSVRVDNETARAELKDRLLVQTALHDRAVRALTRAGFTDNGGAEWKPPIGDQGRELREAKARIEELEAALKTSKVERDVSALTSSSMLSEIGALRRDREARIAEAEKLKKQLDRAMQLACGMPHVIYDSSLAAENANLAQRAARLELKLAAVRRAAN